MLYATPHALRVLDLFSCIGGHALGLHAAGGFQTVRFVEVNPFRRRVLARHFPGVPIDEDVATLDPERGSADLVIGGPPCQKTSVASAIQGKRTGESLWPMMRRICERVEPAWIVVEQPPGNAAWEAEVTSDLAGLGYRTARLGLAATDFGAPHQRRRVFILAHRDLSRLQVAGQARSWALERLSGGAFAGNPWGAGVPGSLRVADGIPGGLERRERIEALGDSNPPIMMTAIGLCIQAAELVTRITAD
jgi:DNA (cytosine-5)-methyltransferase 1